MSKVIVTGSDGFIGQVLVSKLKDDGHNVVGLGRKDGDISKLELADICGHDEAKHIFHLASKTFVPDSWDSPGPFYETAVVGTQNVLEFCRKNNVNLTYVSAYLYGEPDVLPIKEDNPLKPNNPYAHSKSLAEELCRFYSECYGVNVVIARPFNIYGPRQRKEFLIPLIIDQALHFDKIKLKDLSPKRDYLYVDDLVDGLLATMAGLKGCQVFNFGSGESYSPGEILEIVFQIMGKKKEVESFGERRKNEIMDVKADISAAKGALNWSPRVSLKEGLEKMILQLQKGL